MSLVPVRFAGSSAAVAKALSAAKPTTSVYVECRECAGCNHVGMNDSKNGIAACNSCGWHGAEPAADQCPGCSIEGTMSAACPKCESLYKLLVGSDIAIDNPQAPSTDLLAQLLYKQDAAMKRMSAASMALMTAVNKHVASDDRTDLGKSFEEMDEALAAAVGVQVNVPVSGMAVRLVPEEPTEAMMDAMEACSSDWPRTTWKQAWAAALSAIPSVPVATFDLNLLRNAQKVLSNLKLIREECGGQTLTNLVDETMPRAMCLVRDLSGLVNTKAQVSPDYIEPLSATDNEVALVVQQMIADGVVDHVLTAPDEHEHEHNEHFHTKGEEMRYLALSASAARRRLIDAGSSALQ